ncbi:YSIRK-type signal peptide-containing protein [Limosilactobacillus allomucosae]|uniref:YSIRK-type signal peptide-containing protein n=1 Tax=Limosilactobacillus allomucosae TaxID=3142938 RepID=A0AAU7C0X6_9LACO
MYSKNNKYMQEQKSANHAQRFGLRKLSIGTVSVLLGTLMFFGNGQVSADTTNGTDTSAEATNVNSTANDTSTSAVTLSSTGSAAASAQTATVAATSANSQSAAATSTADSSQTASAASTATNDVSSASSAATTADSQAVSDDALTSKGEIVAKDKLSDSDANPGMSNANGATITADQSQIPSGYAADPTEGRYTFGILSLGPVTASDLTSYNQKYNTNYYIRVSVAKNGNNGVYDDTVYIQLVDADTNTVLWETTSVPGDTNKKVGYLKNTSDNTYYTYSYTETVVNGVASKGINFTSNLGNMYSINVYEPSNPTKNAQATSIGFDYPIASTLETRYIAKDAAGNDVILATYDETGRIGYQYTASGVRNFVGFDLTNIPSSISGTLKRNYKVGDVYITGQRNLSGTKENPVLQIARVQVITDTDGTSRIQMRVAKADASLSDINDSSIWKTIFTSEELKPGEMSSIGNNSTTYNGVFYSNGAFTVNLSMTDKEGNKLNLGLNELKKAGFTEDQLTGWNNFTMNWLLLNRLTLGQKTIDYYYAPQGQVRINYVTSDGTVIQNPTTAYENSGNNTSYDVTGSNYRPETITVNGKTYRYVKADKSLGTAGTTTVKGFTYTTTPSDATGTINSNNVNDVYFVYEQVTYHTEAETKDVTRTIEYYDSVTGEPIPSDLESTVTQTATLKRNKIYDDQNNFIGYGTISADGSSYTIDDSWKADAQTWTQQDSADLSDYGYTAPDRASVAAVTVDGNTTNVTEKVYYGHQTMPVTPTNPGTPGEPINPKGDVTYPDGVAKDDLTDTVKRTINYVDANGNPVNGSPDGTRSYEQTVTFERTAIVDKVTGKILGYDTNNDGKVDTDSADRAWTPLSAELSEVKSADPKTLGFDNVDKSAISTVTVVPGQADLTETVVYSNNPVVVSGTITYIDDTTGVTLDQDSLPSGEVGSKINYTTAGKIANYEDQGYELVANDFTDGSQVYKKTGNDFVVHLKHKTQTITPNDPNPVTPGDPINPNDPNSPVYPTEADRNNLVKDASQTIHYVGAGDMTPADNTLTQKDAFTRTVTIDKVTGKVLSTSDWEGTKTFDTVDTPFVDGYHADKKTAGGLTATPDNPDVEETVTYAPNGKIVPVDPNGTPIPGADTPTYPTDPNDPTKVVPNEPIPDVPGYTPVDPSPVTPADPGKDTPVPYVQVVTGTIKYVDDTTGKTLSSSDLPSGAVGSTIKYTTADKIKAYEDQGYELVSNNFADGTQTYAKEGNDFVVHLKHKAQTITPNDPTPVTPGQPINPNDPDSPVYPTDADRNNLVKDATQTIHYVGAGDKTPTDKVQTQKDAFTRTVTIDKVTGEVISMSDWEGTKTFGTEDTPVIDGYHADKKTAGGLTATPDNPDVEETVTYSPNGKIVPVDPNGTPIPGADTPTYPTDPNDPTKVVPDEPIPDVPGYTPVDPSPVTPADPGKDTPVPYTQNQYGLTEKFVDEDGNELSPSVDKGSSYKSGDGFDVTGDAKVINGYVLVKQDNTKGTFGNGDETATFIYKKIGKIIPVDENGTPIPGADTPIYQNDPNDPTKVIPNEPIPEVPGYTPVDPSPITPADPTEDTPVPYTKKETPTTPDTPSTPTTPTTPSTPTTPGEATTPVTPAEQPQTPAAPAGQGQATPTSAKTEAAKQATLPQTGNDKNEATAAMGLGFAGIASMLALFGTRKKRRED